MENVVCVLLSVKGAEIGVHRIGLAFRANKQDHTNQNYNLTMPRFTAETSYYAPLCGKIMPEEVEGVMREIKIEEHVTFDHLRSSELMVLAATRPHKHTQGQRASRKRMSQDVAFVESTKTCEVQGLTFSSPVPPHWDEDDLRQVMGDRDTHTGPTPPIPARERATHRREAEPETHDLWGRLQALVVRPYVPKSLTGKYIRLSHHRDTLIDSIETIVLFYWQYLRARTFGDRMMAIVAMSKILGTKLSLTAVGANILTSALEHFMGPGAGGEESRKSQPAEFQTQGWEESFDTFQGFLDRYDTLKTLPIYGKLYKFGCFALALSLFKPLGVDMDLMRFDKVAQEALRKKYHAGPDFVHSLLDTALFLVRRGYQSYVAGSVLPFFHSEDKYQAWFDKAELLQRQALLLSNPEPHGIDRFAYLSDLKDAIEQGRSMKKYAVRKDEKLVIGKLLGGLELTHDLEITKRAAQKDRKTPLCMLLYGGSGIGKSTIQNVLFQHYGKVRGLNTRSEYRYVRNPTEQFWSGMNSTQWCVVLDDIAFMAPQLGVLDPSLAEMLCIANNVPFVPAQAELSDKGRTPVRAELVLGSTNTEHLNLTSNFSCPLAVQRRFPWVIDIAVKREFQDPDKPGMLDSARVPATPAGEYPDLWHFTIKRIEPAGEDRNHQRGRTVVDQEITNMRDFIRWYNTVIAHHNTIQDKIMASNERAYVTNVCPLCKAPVNWCECEESVQALEAPVMPDLFGENEMAFTAQRAAYLEYTESRQPSAVVGREAAPTRWTFYWYYLIYVWVYSTWLGNVVAFFWGPFWFWGMVAASPFRWRLTRLAVRLAGARAQLRFATASHGRELAMVGAAILGVGLLYKANKHILGTLWSVQGNTGGRAPVPDEVPIPRPSYQDKYPFDNADLSQQTLTSKGNNGEVLKANIKRALCVFTSVSEGKTRVVTALNIRGSVYVCNAHGIPPTTPFSMSVVTQKRDGLSTNIPDILVTKSMVEVWAERDLAFIRLDCLPPGTDLTAWMPGPQFTARLEGTYLGRRRDGTLWERPVRNLCPHDATWKSHDTEVTAPTWAGFVEQPTEVGDCGTVLVSHSPAGWVILGLHTLGRGDQVRAVRLDNTLLERAAALQPHVVARGRLSVSAPSVTRTLTDLASQSVTRETGGVANVIGSFAGEFRQRARTHVAKTLISDLVAERLGYEHTRTKPDMGKRPWVLALKDMVRPVLSLDSDRLRQATEMFIAETRVRDYSAVHVYDLATAINGCPGLEYCDKLNRKSSAGAPYKRSKSHYMYFIDEATSTDMGVIEEIEDTVEAMIETYKRGERVHAVFCGHLKDEPVTHAKAAAGKTRVFTAAGMAHTLVTRMYLLPVIVFIQKRRYVYETGVGVVAQGLEWQEMYEYLTAYGDTNMIAGDYAKFDKRMPPNVILATFDIMLDICKRGGYTDDELAVVRGIAYDTAFPTVDFNGDLVEFFGSNPSGHALTVIVNSLANSLYMRYTFLSLRPQACNARFKEVVKLMTYGDDNAMGVRDGYEWFNHTAVQATLAKVEIEYTMADKEALSVPYIHMSEISFLKRTWRWDDDLRAHVAPLARESLEKMLMVCVQKKNISPEFHAMQVISTAVRECFFYGKEQFDQMSSALREVVEEAGLSVYVEDTTFPTWQQLAQDFEERSTHVTCRRVRM